jgi:hypothetical protein
MMMSFENEQLKELKKCLVEFKNLTIELIECSEKEEYDNLEILFNQRDTLIQQMDKLEYSKENFKELSYELQLMPLEQKLVLIINKSKTGIRLEIDKLATSKIANKSYNTKYKADPLFFNKQI